MSCIDICVKSAVDPRHEYHGPQGGCGSQFKYHWFKELLRVNKYIIYANLQTNNLTLKI